QADMEKQPTPAETLPLRREEVHNRKGDLTTFLSIQSSCSRGSNGGGATDVAKSG
ncbi:hypothetical protein C0991_003687, partial [Blastosporella zonata]